VKILTIADKEAPVLWEYLDRNLLDGVDLVLSCGDLAPQYLSFLATFVKCPVLYVHGNHDDCYDQTPPEGCICVEDTIYVHQGIRILGLGGSLRYKPGIHQYTQTEMNRRIRKLWLSLKRNGGIDILLAHAPAQGLFDGKDLPHQGFQGFRHLLDTYRPAYFVHGHVHPSYGTHPREFCYHSTKIINAYEKQWIEYPRP
jgi:predicted phosphodiesterase